LRAQFFEILGIRNYLLERRLIMGKKWKKLWLMRKVAAAKKAAQEAVEIVEETVKTTKKGAKKKKRWPWGKKKED
jgi:fatty acid-binding protein DegV